MGVINYCNKVPLLQIYRTKPCRAQPSSGGPERVAGSPTASLLALIIWPMCPTFLMQSQVFFKQRIQTGHQFVFAVAVRMSSYEYECCVCVCTLGQIGRYG